MKITQKNLQKYIDKSKLSIVEIVRRMNLIQDSFSPGKRLITRKSVYFYLAGHTPPSDKIYILSAVLGTHPKNIFGITYDQNTLENTQALAAKL